MAKYSVTFANGKHAYLLFPREHNIDFDSQKFDSRILDDYIIERINEYNQERLQMKKDPIKAEDAALYKDDERIYVTTF